MIKFIKLFVVCAVATLGFSACQQEEINYNEETTTHTVTFIAESPETKTTVDISDGETAKFAWTADDQDRFTAYENGTAATETVGNLDVKTGKMTLMATFAGDAPASPKYQALYNSAVSATQSPDGSYAEVTDVMVSNVLDGPRDNTFIFSFKREVSFAKMTLKGLTSGAYVSSVTIESDKPIAGQYDLKTGTFINTSNVITLDVLTDVADGNATVWFTTIPVEEATFTITAETINEDMTIAATYTKTFSKTITLTRGDVKGFGVTMTKDVIAAPEPVVLYCSDVTTGAYVDKATHVKNENLPFEYLQIMANKKNNPTEYGAGQVMQFKSNSGEIYNTKSFGSPVKYVEVYAQSSNPFYVHYGDQKAPSENKISRPTTPSGTKTISIKDNNDNTNVEKEVNYYLLNLSSYNANYIRIVNGSKTNYFYKIVLLFDEPETVQVTGIELDKTEVIINEGEKTTLTATIAPADASIKDVNWTSDNETVATVTDGVVSGLSVGSATITATTVDGEFTASCVVTVNELSKISTIAEIKAILKEGTSSETKAFDARLTKAIVTYVNDSNAFIEDESAAIVYYKSGHGLTVGDVLSGEFAGSGYSYNGIVEITSVTTEPTKTAGTAPDPTVVTLAQISENFDAYDSRWIKLENVTTGVALASGTRTSSVSQNETSLPLYAKVKDIALAEESFGDMICIPCYNKTTKQIGFWEAVHFTAKNVAVTGVTLDKSEVSITVGKTAALTATVTPSNATNKNVTWSSSAESIATVANGVVTAVAEGSATITVTTEDGSHTATCVVTVSAAPAGGVEKIATLAITSSVTKSNITLTDDQNNSWTFTTDGDLTENTSYIQAGTKSKKVTYVKLVSTGLLSKKIKKIQLWGTSKANSNVTPKIIIGNTTIGTGSAYTTQNASTGGTEFSIENTTDVVGEVTLEISRPSSSIGAIYFNKAVITYCE